MEIVYSNKTYDIVDDGEILGIYGDLHNLDIPIEGIKYEEEWTVFRFLNNNPLIKKNNLDDILSLLNIDNKLLNKKIKYLSRTDFKFILLCYLIINNKKNIIFDNFEIGLTYKDQKKLINIIRRLNTDGYNIIIISHDLVFMDKIVNKIEVYRDNKSIFYGTIDALIRENIIEDNSIIRFIKMANKKNANLELTLDSKELLKDIYRSVEV